MQAHTSLARASPSHCAQVAAPVGPAKGCCRLYTPCPCNALSVCTLASCLTCAGAQVVSVAATFSEVWEAVGSLLTEVDVLAAFAELAVTAPLPYVRPVMLPPDDGEISLVGCRCAPHVCMVSGDELY